MVLLVYCSDEHLILISPNPGKLGGSINIHFVQDSDRLSHRNGPTPKTLKNNNPPKKTFCWLGNPSSPPNSTLDASRLQQKPRRRRVLRSSIGWCGTAAPRLGHCMSCVSCEEENDQEINSEVLSLHLQVPPQKVFEPSKLTPNTFSEGTWRPRV